MRTAEEAARRWVAGIERFVRLGILCRGCGERVQHDRWLSSVYTGKFYCPYCRTPLGSL